MTYYYPSQQELQGLDKLERVLRDVYSRLYQQQRQIKVLGAPQPTAPPVTFREQSALNAAGAFPVSGATTVDIDSSAVLGLTEDSTPFSVPVFYEGTAANMAYITPLPDLSLYHQNNSGRDLYYVARSGGWYYILGTWTDTYANRPDPVTGMSATDAGLLFIDSTYNITWKYNATYTRWDYYSGTISGTLSAIPAGLAAADAGVPFWATDFKHTWVWSGAAWAYDKNDEGSGFIRLCAIAPVTGLWQLCDGSTVNRSNDDGSVTSITVPDYGTAAYVKVGTSVTLGPTAASGTTTSVSGGTPSGTVSQPTFTGDALAAHAHELPFAFVEGTPEGTPDDLWIADEPFGTGTSRTMSGYETFTENDSTSKNVMLSESKSAGTPSGTVSQPTFTGSALSSHNHGPGTLELRNTQLMAYYRL